MKKYLIIILSFFLFFSCNNKQKKKINKEKIYKIGVILPLTGDAAIYGEAMKNGIELAKEKCKNNIQIIYQDDKGEAKHSVSALQNLLSQNIIAAIGGAQSKTALPLLPIIIKNKVPLISPAASTVELDNSSDFFLRLWPSDSYDGKIISDYIIKKYNNKDAKIAIFYTNSAYGEGIKNVFEKNLTNANFNIVFSDKFDEKATDYRTQLQKIKKSKATVLFLPGYYANIKIILKQIEELNIDVDIVGTTSFYDNKLLSDKRLKNIIEGIVFSYPAFNDTISNEKSKVFLKSYKNKYNKKANVFAANAYDCLSVLDSSISFGVSNSEDIKNNIYKISNFKGVSGDFSFDKNGNVKKDFVLYKIHNGKPVVIN